MAAGSKKARNRIYWRMQGTERRAYGDFRDFSDVGGRREALVPRGGKLATSDALLAEAIAADRIRDLQERRRNRTILGIERQARLAEFASHHLVQKRRSGRFTTQWLEAVQMHLETAVRFFCNRGREIPRDADNGELILANVVDRDLASIDVAEVQAFTAWLASRTNGRGAALAPSSQRKYLNSLSNLYRRAISEACVPPGYNPVQAMMDKPQDGAHRREANWLEVPAAAALLVATLNCKRAHPHLSIPPVMLHAIVATMLLTGGRPGEVLGLLRGDVSFDRRIVTFRPNAFRRLKTASSTRSMPLWPQLERILRHWIDSQPSREPGALLFPSTQGGGLVRDIRKALDDAASTLGWGEGAIRPYAFRHTYCAARLQTLDRGHPVSPWTVAREMGHGGRSLVDRVYGHLGEVRRRSEFVEYSQPDTESAVTAA